MHILTEKYDFKKTSKNAHGEGLFSQHIYYFVVTSRYPIYAGIFGLALIAIGVIVAIIVLIFLQFFILIVCC
jgi:hypothetical protein